MVLRDHILKGVMQSNDSFASKPHLHVRLLGKRVLLARLLPVQHNCFTIILREPDTSAGASAHCPDVVDLLFSHCIRSAGCSCKIALAWMLLSKDLGYIQTTRQS